MIIANVVLGALVAASPIAGTPRGITPAFNPTVHEKLGAQVERSIASFSIEGADLSNISFTDSDFNTTSFSAIQASEAGEYRTSRHNRVVLNNDYVDNNHRVSPAGQNVITHTGYSSRQEHGQGTAGIMPLPGEVNFGNDFNGFELDYINRHNHHNQYGENGEFNKSQFTRPVRPGAARPDGSLWNGDNLDSFGFERNNHHNYNYGDSSYARRDRKEHGGYYRGNHLGRSYRKYRRHGRIHNRYVERAKEGNENFVQRLDRYRVRNVNENRFGYYTDCRQCDKLNRKVQTPQQQQKVQELNQQYSRMFELQNELRDLNNTKAAKWQEYRNLKKEYIKELKAVVDTKDNAASQGENQDKAHHGAHHDNASHVAPATK